MAKQLRPAKIRLLSPNPKQLMAIRQVRSLNVYEGATEAFDPNGLFSVETFGRVGEKTRLVTFGYIDAKLEVLHPHVHKAVCNLKELYGKIMAGTAYAKWDAKTKNFIEVSANEGETGYAFFMRYWDDLNFPRTKSVARDGTLAMIENNRQSAKVRYILVLPAGLRDLEIVDGRPSEDEINGFYRRLLATSQTVNDSVKPDDPINDRVRHQIQTVFNEIYALLFERMDGKHSFIQSRFMARAVWHATSNVITAMDVGEGDLYAINCPSPIQYRVGLFQFIHGILPRFYYDFREKFLRDKVWGQENATLIHPISLKSVSVPLTGKLQDKFSSEEGLFKLALQFEDIKFRNKPAMIKGHYLKLIVINDDTFYLADNIEGVQPDHQKLARAMTWGEVFYYSVYAISREVPDESTRYPVAGEGSAVIFYTDLATTLPDRILREVEYHPEGEIVYLDRYARWPTHDNEIWLESAQPHPCRHRDYGADHDGDKMTNLFSVAKEAKEEIATYYQSWDSVYGANGELTVNLDMDVTQWVLAGATNKNIGV